jgi:hypothetical protein
MSRVSSDLACPDLNNKRFFCYTRTILGFGEVSVSKFTTKAELFADIRTQRRRFSLPACQLVAVAAGA